MEIIDYAKYVTYSWVIEYEMKEYIVRLSENDIYDGWEILDDGDIIDNESDLGKILIEFCVEEINKK